jgi:hypothetical protein
MEVHEGFITFIYNYCDRWCETCAFTSWCRLFADQAESKASDDVNLKAVVDAPLLPEDQPPEAPKWFLEMIDEAQREAALAPDPVPPRPEFERDNHPLARRAMDYSLKVHTWLAARQIDRSTESPSDPLAIISWYSTLIPAKIGRALHGLAWLEPDDPDDPRDYDGSAKVALIGIERSHAAWLQLAESCPEVGSFIGDLVWLTDAIEDLFPAARAFVRPAFDEPEAVARLAEIRERS